MPFNKSLTHFKAQLSHNEVYFNDIVNALDAEKDIGLRGANANLITAMDAVKHSVVANPRLIRDLIHPASAAMSSERINVNFTTTLIDASQKSAVKKALLMGNLLAIQGPPGAGKTTTIVEMIKQLRMRDPHVKVLVTSQSHVAVDNVINKLALDGFARDLARVRPTERTESEMAKYDVPRLYNEVMRKSDKKLKRVLDSYRDKNALYGNKYVSANRAGFMLTKDVVGVTINSLSSCNFGVNGMIDYAIIDEVGKCNFAEVLMVAQIAKRLIIIGDPAQLPAVMHPFHDHDTYNKEAYRFIEDNPFVTYIFDNINPAAKEMLDRQYRMSDLIGTYISREFYGGKLANGDGKNNFYIADALNFIDYDARPYYVGQKKPEKGERTLLQNDREIEIIKELLKTTLRHENRKNIAIIAPYQQQVAALRKAFPEFNHRNISTVDAFQGREERFVIFSCVRNYGLPTTYFRKENRLNVAISRAIEKIYIVGSAAYVNQVPYLRNYINFKDEVTTKRGAVTARCNLLYYTGDKIVPHK